MDKPDDIPQDVWDVAVYIAPLWASSREPMALEKGIASAILKAKNDAYEECASLATKRFQSQNQAYGFDYARELPHHQGAYDEAHRISKAIRNLKHEG